jgi:hypothetical protein
VETTVDIARKKMMMELSGKRPRYFQHSFSIRPASSSPVPPITIFRLLHPPTEIISLIFRALCRDLQRCPKNLTSLRHYGYIHQILRACLKLTALGVKASLEIADFSSNVLEPVFFSFKAEP